jgi:hypothetical protein
MFECANKKNKIVLTDYNYKRDIENRLLMAHFSVFDVTVLHEILSSSLIVTGKTIAEHLDTTEKKLQPTLEKLSKTKLLTYSQGVITVDKELRKYYEVQILKFDDNFEPGVEYLQSILNKVPIHVLPIWYVIPRSSDNIFASIVEKYLFSPKIYERYAAEMIFDNPVCNQIIDDVFTAPDFEVTSNVLRKKYKLSAEQFEEYMLHLEYNLICCLSYKCIGDQWEEVVTPFYEWREYLRFKRDTEPQPILDVAKIKRTHPDDYGFINDMTTRLKKVIEAPQKVKEKDATTEMLLQLHLVTEKNGQLHSNEHSTAWLKKSLQDQAIMIYRLPMTRYRYLYGNEFLVSDRDIREAERSLKRVINKGWFYFDDFM